MIRTLLTTAAVADHVSGLHLRAVCEAVQHDLLLLEVPAVLLVDQHQVEQVADAELIVHVAVRRRRLVRRQVQPARAIRGLNSYPGRAGDGNSLSSMVVSPSDGRIEASCGREDGLETIAAEEAVPWLWRAPGLMRMGCACS